MKFKTKTIIVYNYFANCKFRSQTCGFDTMMNQSLLIKYHGPFMYTLSLVAVFSATKKNTGIIPFGKIETVALLSERTFAPKNLILSIFIQTYTEKSLIKSFYPL